MYYKVVLIIDREFKNYFCIKMVHLLPVLSCELFILL